MELKICDKCGGNASDLEFVKISYTIYHYCDKCLQEIKEYLNNLRAESLKILATRLSK